MVWLFQMYQPLSTNLPWKWWVIIGQFISFISVTLTNNQWNRLIKVYDYTCRIYEMISFLVNVNALLDGSEIFLAHYKKWVDLGASATAIAQFQFTRWDWLKRPIVENRNMKLYNVYWLSAPNFLLNFKC